jgi:hypothetical protein
MERNPQSIQTGSDNLNQIITILLRTGMFVAGFLGFFLDNTIPGTYEREPIFPIFNSSKVYLDSQNVISKPKRDSLSNGELVFRL